MVELDLGPFPMEEVEKVLESLAQMLLGLVLQVL